MPAARSASSEADDLLLMEQIHEGDRDSLRELVGRYWKPLVTYAASVVSGTDEAEDVVQEVFVRVWRFRSKWQPSGTVAAYLYRITRNLALNAVRDAQSQRKREERGSEHFLDRAPERSALERVEDANLRKEVEDAIAKLPTRRREIFVLSRFHGLSHREIATALEISVPTVSNQMTAALSQLRELLAHRVQQ